MDGSVDFYRNWANYKLGFGDVNAEHWLGNDKINILLNATDANNELRVDMESLVMRRRMLLMVVSVYHQKMMAID